jgi:hypothetical protein
VGYIQINATCMGCHFTKNVLLVLL